MTVLDDLKEHLIANGITDDIYLNYADIDAGNCVILWLCGSKAKDLGMNAKIQFIIKDSDMTIAQNISDFIYDIIYPMGQFQKNIEINGKAMQIKPLQSPYYTKRDEQNRHEFIFEAEIDYERKAAAL